MFWVIGGILVICVCLLGFMVRRAPMDTELWGPDGEPQLKRGWREGYEKGRSHDIPDA